MRSPARRRRRRRFRCGRSRRAAAPRSASPRLPVKVSRFAATGSARVGRPWSFMRSSPKRRAPSPLAGEAPGTGGRSVKSAATPPPSRTLPARGRGRRACRGRHSTSSSASRTPRYARRSPSRSPRRRAGRELARPGSSRETGTPAMMPFAASASTTPRGRLRQAHRELVEERLVQHLDARHLRQRIGELAGARMVRLREPPQARLAEQRHVRREGEQQRPELVQMLEVALSRRMCCSRVESVSTKPRLPSASTVSPQSRPGIWRMIFLPRGEEADIGPAEIQRVADRLALADDDVGALRAGRLDQPERHDLGEDGDEQRAVLRAPSRRSARGR